MPLSKRFLRQTSGPSIETTTTLEVEVEKDGDECERCHVTYAQSSPERK